MSSKTEENVESNESKTNEKEKIIKPPLHVSVASPLNTPVAEYHPSSPRSRALYGTSRSLAVQKQFS